MGYKRTKATPPRPRRFEKKHLATITYAPLGFDWCSDQSSGTDCATVGAAAPGICYPTTPDMLEMAKYMQRRVNAIRASGKVPGVSKSLINVDGRPGDDTRNAVNEIVAAVPFGLLVSGPFAYCDNLMSDIININASLESLRTSLGAPLVKDPTTFLPSSKPSVVKNGKVFHPPTDSAQTIWFIAALGIGGLLWYKSKKGR